MLGPDSRMLDETKIRQIARDVATAQLSSENFSSILSSSVVDSEGHDALRITIVIKAEAVSKITGDAVLDTLVQIRNRLLKEGEERFPLIEYATEKELSESGDL
jgi:hypothetical protein